MWDDLVCPVDHHALEGHAPWLACRECGRGFPVLDCIPTFQAQDDPPRWVREQRRLAGFLKTRPSDEARYARRDWLRERAGRLDPLFARVCPASRRRVLQFGVLQEAEVHHVKGAVRYAVDPLAGVMAEFGTLTWGEVRWVASCGRQLPFPDANFHAVVIVDALDRTAAPAELFREIRRCLAPDGLVWLELDVAKPSWLSRAWRKMRRSRRAEFPARLSAADLNELLADAGFEMLDPPPGLRTDSLPASFRSSDRTERCCLLLKPRLPAPRSHACATMPALVSSGGSNGRG